MVSFAIAGRHADAIGCKAHHTETAAGGDVGHTVNPDAVAEACQCDAIEAILCSVVGGEDRRLVRITRVVRGDYRRTRAVGDGI